MPFYQSKAECVSCGHRIDDPYYDEEGNAYCEADYEVHIDHDRVDLIEDAYQEFHNLIQLFTS